MSFIDDMKIGKKMILGYLVVIIILVVVAAIGYINMGALDAADTAMYEDRVIPLDQLGQVNGDFQQMRAEMYRYIYVPESRETIAKTTVPELRANIKEKMDAYRATYLTPEEEKALAEFDSNYAAFNTHYDALMAAVDKNDMKAVDAALSAGSPIITAREGAVNAIHKMLEINEKEAEKLSVANTALYNSSAMMMIIATVVGVILAVVLALYLSRSITRPLDQAVKNIQEMGKGHLGNRLKLNRKDEIGIMAAAMDQFSEDLQVIVVGAMKKIAAGDLTANIQAKDSQDEIVPALIQMRDAIKALVADADMLAKAAVEGKLSTRADATRHQGDYRKIVEGVNETLDAVIGPLNVAAKYVEEIGKGNIPQKITESYRGDFNTLKSSINNCIDGLQGLVECDQVLHRMAVNDNTRKVEGKYQGIFATMAESTNLVRERLLAVTRQINEIAVGDTSDLAELKRVGKRSEEDHLLPAIINCFETVDLLIKDTGMLVKAAAEGQLNTRADASRHQGEYRTIVEGINKTLDTVVAPLNEAMRVCDRYAAGDFTARWNSKLTTMGEFQKFREALDNIGVQVSKALSLVNQQLTELGASAEEANASIEEVSAGSAHVAKNAAAVSSNAEQSSQGINEVLKAMEDLSKTIQQVAAKAESVSTLVQETNDYSRKGIELAKKTEAGMNGITRSSNEVNEIILEIKSQMDKIGEIVNLITDLANQTNLLALNAAIEAARAGDAGRGFAVVATEVKSLAEESRVSAEKIAEMIGNLQKQTQTAAETVAVSNTEVKEGSIALKETLENFNRIVESIDQISRNVTEVATASEEQAASVEEVTASINEVNSLVRNAAKEATDAAAVSEESAAAIDQITKVIANVNNIVVRVSTEVSKFKI
ncbi:MAG: methyl-accepting chemotaxis protein [Methanolinea sp.]|nr:methyl-accepting chemotaxis protein [Methanolinea sp.]